MNEHKQQEMIDTINCLYEYLKEEEKQVETNGVDCLSSFMKGELHILETLKKIM